MRQASRILDISAGLLGLKSQSAYTAASCIPHGISGKNFHSSRYTTQCLFFTILMVSPTKYYSNPECFLPAVKIKYARPTVKKCKLCLQVGEKKRKKQRRSLWVPGAGLCAQDRRALAAGTGRHRPAPHDPRQQRMSDNYGPSKYPQEVFINGLRK